MIDLIGYFGAFLTTASFVPQAFQTIRTRNTDGISLAMYLMFVSGVIFWLLYGCLIDNKILIFSNSIVLTLSGMILWVKISNILNKK
jgi:MtN3 and saliva related transmembrane protein